MSLFNMFKGDPIKNEIYAMIEKNIDFQKKGVKKISEIKKSDLDSIELLTLFKEIEKKWGPMNLAAVYKAQSLDEIVTLIKKQSNTI